jgi:class 3 adenylate cyclase
LKHRNAKQSKAAKAESAIIKTALMKRHFGPNTIGTVRYSDVVKIKSRIISIVFWDIRGFTSLCNSLGAEFQDLIPDLILPYERAARKHIDKNYGMFDKMMGDGIMASFGVPSFGESQDTVNAVNSAISLRKEFDTICMRWAEKLATSGYEKPLKIGLGCGINTGRVIFGKLGSEQSGQLTGVGTAVNLAQRLESHALGGEILISHSTMANVKGHFNISKVRRRSFPGFGKVAYHNVCSKLIR